VPLLALRAGVKYATSKHRRCTLMWTAQRLNASANCRFGEIVETVTDADAPSCEEHGFSPQVALCDRTYVMTQQSGGDQL